MPTILEAYNPKKGKPWAPDPLPEIQDNEYYWFNPMTNEVFSSFEAYFARSELYDMRVWSCRITGKSSLTYKEALETEDNISDFLADFPSEHLRLLMTMVHGSQELLDPITCKVHKKLQTFFVPGDVVRWKRKTAKVIELHEKSTDEDKFYTIRWSDKKKNTFTEVAASSELIRTDFSLTWNNVRFKIRQVARRPKKFKGSPWIVPDELLRKHGLEEAIDPKITRLLEEQNDVPSRKTKRQSKQSEEEKPKKRRKKKTDEAEKEKERKRQEMRKEYLSKLNHMLPVDDLALLYLQGPSSTSLPAGSPFQYPVPQESFSDFIMLWRFLTYFAKPLSLFPFSFDDFLESLTHTESIAIIDETFVSLLRCLNAQPKVNRGNWEGVLQSYLRESSESEPAQKLRPVIGTDVCFGEDSLDGSSIGGDGDSEIGEDVDGMGSGSEEENDESGDKLNGYLSAGDLARRQEKKEVAKVFEMGWKKVSLSDRVRALWILSDDALDSLSEGQLRKSLDQALEKKISLQKEKWQTTREIGKKVKQLDEDIQSKSSLEKEQVFDPSLSERQKCKYLAEGTKQLKKLELAKKLQKDLISKKTESLNRKIEKYYIRELPLGYDRWFNRYWYFSEIPNKLFIERSPYFSPAKQKELMEMEPAEKNPSILEKEHYFPGDISEERAVFEYYDTKEQLEQLYDHLNEGGVREKKLVSNLEPVFNKIVASATKKQHEALREAIGEAGVARRSTRIKTPEKEADIASHLTYVNVWEKGKA